MQPDTLLDRQFIGDSRIDATLGRLYADTLRTDPATRREASRRGLDEDSPGFYQAMKNAYMPVTPDLGMLLYLLVRGTLATTVVEFGTSLGISAIWMAAALRANGAGRLLTTEMDEDKARRASLHLQEAGLAHLVDVRVGPAEQTLRSPFSQPIDLLFLDGAKSLYLPVLRLLEPSMRTGTLILADNTDMPASRPFLAHVQDPRNGYRAADIATQALGATHPCKMLMRC